MFLEHFQPSTSFIQSYLHNYVDLKDDGWKMVDLFTLSFLVQAAYHYYKNDGKINWTLGAVMLFSVVFYNIMFYKFFQ